MKRLSVPLLLLAAWILLVRLGSFSPVVLPSPERVATTAWGLLFGTNPLWPDFSATLMRCMGSFAVSLAIGAPLGLLMGATRVLREALEPTIDFARAIPPIVLMPIFILALGIGELTRLVVPIYGATLVMLVSGIYGVTGGSPLRRDVGRVLRLSPRQALVWIVFPDAAVGLWAGARIAIGLCLVLTIVVELLLPGRFGLGVRLHEAQLVFRTSEVYVVVLLTGALGFMLNRGILLLQRVLSPWMDVDVA